MLTNTKTKNTVARKVRKGFTLVELLVVTLILSILMAVALPLYLDSVKDSKKKANLANMQTIANAVQAQRLKNGDNDFSTLITANGTTITTTSLKDLPQVPVGPDGETYHVETSGTPAGSSFKVKCSGTDNASLVYEPGVTHNAATGGANQ